MFEREINLDPASQLRASLPDETQRRSRIMERVRHIYLRTARDTLLQQHFDRLIEDLTERRNPAAEEGPEERAERLEGNIFVVLGESGAGKTTAIRRLVSKYHQALRDDTRNQPGPVLTVRVPSPCSVGELGRVVLRRTGYRLRRSRVSAPEVWGIVRERIQDLGILVLHLDEFQDAHETLDKVEQVKLRHLLRSLLVDEENPIGLIISGQPEFEDFIRPDRSSTRRGQWQLFERIALPADARSILTAVRELAREAELSIVEEDVEHVVVPRLVKAGCSLLGITIEEIHDAIRTALEDRSTDLNLEHFRKSYAFRTGSHDRWNPYHAVDYLALDCTRVLARRDPVLVPDPDTSGRKGRKKGAEA